MGEVWRARDTVIDRVVAIKVLSAKLSKNEEFQRRFRREAQAAARLETPHVVPIYDYGESAGVGAPPGRGRYRGGARCHRRTLGRARSTIRTPKP